jgi:hypothetical protein
LNKTAGVAYYQPIADFLNKLPTAAQRRNQVGIWLQNFWSKVTIFDNVTFANKVRDDFNFAGEFLKKASDATYAAEAENGIH